MENDNDFKIFLFISLRKLIISVLDSKNQNIYKKEFFIKDTSNFLNLKIIEEFLDKNIFKVEKTLKKFINNIFLIIDYDNFFSINLSLKNKINYNEVRREQINSLLIEAKNECKKTLESNKIIHAKIDKFVIDNIDHFSLPEKVNCSSLSIDIGFICLPIQFINDLEKVFNKYQIFISKIIYYKYLSNFVDSKKKDIFYTAAQILEGYNENEAIIVSENQEKKGFFDRFFNYFN